VECGIVIDEGQMLGYYGTNMRLKLRSEAGFTVIDMLLAGTLFAMGSVVAIAVTTSTMTALRADHQTRRLVSLMHLGREMAISTSRDHELQFDVAHNTVRLMRMNGGLATEVKSLIFEYGVRFMQYPGFGDTPEGYGADGVVNFGSATRFIFEPDGSFIDETGLPLNGTVFLGIADEVDAARAVTITGTTARSRMYRWDQSASVEGAWARR